jgi:O-methyltransferase
LSEDQLTPDDDFVPPDYSSWPGWDEFQKIYTMAQPHTLVSQDRCWVLYSLAQMALQLPGHVYEAGVYRGGTAIILRHVLAQAETMADQKLLRLFDTFAGMPDTNPDHDVHQSGDFDNTDVAAVQGNVGAADFIAYHPGLIPETFAGLEDDRICFAHVDVDIYHSILDTCAFVYPRLSPGGFMLFDDYGFPSCPGAKQAVDEFFSDKPEDPRLLRTRQAVVNKSEDE